MSSFQVFSVLFRKHWLYHFRCKNQIKELIAILVVAGICYLLNTGGGQSIQNIPLYMPLALMLFCRSSVLTWVSEKQYKHAEVQKIMGASFATYVLSWSAFFILNGIVLSLVFLGVLYAGGVFESLSYQEITDVVGLYFLLMVSILGFCLMLSTIFSDAQLAAQVLTFIQLFGVAFSALLNIDQFRKSEIAMQLTSLIPSVCFQFTFLFISQETSQYENLPFSKAKGFTIITIEAIVYFILFLYLEQVVPNQNGTHKHPLFFLRRSKRPRNQLEQNFDVSQISSANFFQEEDSHKTVTCRIQNLQKSFGNKKVVNGIGLNLYKKQIFCLLGHNGAGKSTTINLLTGILKPDKGNINMFGLDYETQMAQIRQKIGVCLQTDVLYDRITVKQHLQFYGKLKGFSGTQLQQKVIEIIRKCCLETQVNKRAETLSGGNKRKLCLACSAIGDSELIFLDEPSSGMDPKTRRMIWGMIEQLRQEGKTIILTTHHLEEAEALSNRIGIMAAGELIILGSCHYIKQKFGVGYNLMINLESVAKDEREKRKEEIREEIKKIVGSFQEDDQTSKKQMRMILQTSHQEHYSELFEFMQTKGIEFSLTMSSLEDIFIRIGLDPQSVLNNEALPQIQKVELPKYLPCYSFSGQVSAVFVKKALTVLRSFSVFISLILPTLYIAIGAVASLAIPTSGFQDQSQQYMVRWYKYYTLVYLMTIAYSFNTSSFCGSIVAERQIKFKYMSFVMGMRRVPYWLGTLLFDMILFWIPTIVMCIIIASFPYSKSQIFIDKAAYFFVLFVSFSLSFLPFTYLWTHAFQKAVTAYRFFPFFIMLIFAILPQVPIYIIPQNKNVKFFLPILSPLFALVNGMVSQQMLGSDAYEYFISKNTRMYVTESIWYYVGILLIQGCVYMTLTIVLDNLKFRLNDKQQLKVEQMNSERSDDLKKQQKKINQITTPIPIIVDSLYKKYPNGFIAIKDNSFCVEAGQTFGLLGPNGAGKSTTFNILTAADSKTLGHVKLLNTQVNRGAMDIFNEVGVCPQFNPIYENLTVKEHLNFFGKLKGLKNQSLEQVIDFYLVHLQLFEFKNQRAGTLSGGNKRKLCVCISLIGNPSLLFLDEPSSGVDAISRRYMWNLISSSSNSKRSIILTTHSIQEAESLCKRIGILIKGQFVCIGTPSKLKKRYGKGYRISVRCQNQEKMKQVKGEIQKAYQTYQIQETRQDLKVSFLVPKQNFKFSEAFKLFYNNLYQSKIIKEYEIAENSLQEVFIYLSKMQPQVLEERFKPSWKFCCWERNANGCRLIC